MLGYRKKFFKEEITPTTAWPVEIVYTAWEDKITLYHYDGKTTEMSTDEYRQYSGSAENVRYAHAELNNNKGILCRIPDVMIVDMPGFESGLDVHDRAIDDYVSRSLVYVIAFPSDELVMKSSIGNILRSLCIHDMPICVVVTKCDKRSDDFEKLLEGVKNKLNRYINDYDVTYCLTSSHMTSMG